MNDRILSLLGICRRAGKLVIGADPSADSIIKRKSRLIIFAKDFSKNSCKPVLSAAHQAGVKVLEINRSKEQLSLALGKLCGVLSIEDKGFSDKLTELINSEMNEQRGELYD
ncbi:MAG: ribosomal L7Ae/L30e/S12e/Gadd45 family protein [Clostridiales bacterium]|nr:ribosomal L7Ae/L30e/S12e/Gadd45 family protein [Clostridiales bacterium]